MGDKRKIKFSSIDDEKKREVLRFLYRDLGLSLRKIADLFDVSHQTIATYMQKFGIDRRSCGLTDNERLRIKEELDNKFGKDWRVNKHKLEKVVKFLFFEKNLSKSEIIKITGMTKRKIYEILSEQLLKEYLLSGFSVDREEILWILKEKFKDLKFEFKKEVKN